MLLLLRVVVDKRVIVVRLKAYGVAHLSWWGMKRWLLLMLLLLPVIQVLLL